MPPHCAQLLHACVCQAPIYTAIRQASPVLPQDPIYTRKVSCISWILPSRHCTWVHNQYMHVLYYARAQVINTMRFIKSYFYTASQAYIPQAVKSKVLWPRETLTNINVWLGYWVQYSHCAVPHFWSGFSVSNSVNDKEDWHSRLKTWFANYFNAERRLLYTRQKPISIFSMTDVRSWFYFFAFHPSNTSISRFRYSIGCI